jgi:hypothetical protein
MSDNIIQFPRRPGKRRQPSRSRDVTVRLSTEIVRDLTDLDPEIRDHVSPATIAFLDEL